MEKYPVLRTAAGAAVVFGWIGILVALLLFLWGIADLAGAAGRYNENALFEILGVFKIGNSFELGLFGVLLILAGEAAKVLIDIEQNTRAKAAGIPRATDAVPEIEVTSDTTGRNIGDREFVPVPFEEIKPDLVYRHKIYGPVTVVQILSRRNARVLLHETRKYQHVNPSDLSAE